MNYYVKADSEQAMWEAFETAGIAYRMYDQSDANNIRPLGSEDDWEPSGSYEWVFTGTALDVIGTIYVETGNTITASDGTTRPELQAVDGFHANVIAKSGLTLPTVSAPTTPYRKWAGE